MVRASVQLLEDTRLMWEPVRVEPGRVLGHLRVRTDGGDAVIFGTPERMREFAAAAMLAAEQADELLRVQTLLAEAGMLERVQG